MVKSIIKKEQTDFDLEKIKRFTVNELNRLSSEQIPFCYQLGSDTIVINNYKIVKIDSHCWRVYSCDQVVFDFFSRRYAIFYCVAAHERDYSLTARLKNSDSVLGNLEYDAQVCRYRFKQANDSSDEWNIELYGNKYSELQLRIERIKKELKKSVDLTKYIKP
jgi:hypothetical protein